MTLSLQFTVFGLVLFCAGAVLGWWGRGARDARRRYDAQIDGYQRVIAERQAGRHERTQPRAGSGAQGKNVPRAGGVLPAKSGADVGRPDYHAARRPARRLVTTAADIPPVIWPEPGTTVPMRPQPPRTSGAGTQTLPRLTATGELRLRGDAIMDRMRREQAVWSHEYAQRCETDRQEAGLNP